MRRLTGGITLVASVALATALAPSIASIAHEGIGGADVVHVCVVPGTRYARILSASPTRDCPDGVVQGLLPVPSG